MVLSQYDPEGNGTSPITHEPDDHDDDGRLTPNDASSVADSSPRSATNDQHNAMRHFDTIPELQAVTGDLPELPQHRPLQEVTVDLLQPNTRQPDANICKNQTNHI